MTSPHHAQNKPGKNKSGKNKPGHEQSGVGQAGTLLSDARLLRLLLRGRRRLMIVGVVASLLNAGLTLWLISQLKALLVGIPEQPANPAVTDAIPLSRLGLEMGLVLLLILGTHFLAGRSLASLGAQALLRLRQQMSAAILATAGQRLEQLGQGRIYAAFAEDLPKLGVAFTAMPTVLLNSVLSVAAIAYLAWVSWQHTVFILVLLGLGLIFSEGFLLRRVKQHSSIFRRSMDTLYQHIGALVYGHKELQLNRARRSFFTHQQLQPGLQRIYTSVRRRDDYTTAYSAWSITFSLFLVSAVLLAGHSVLPMTAPVMVVFALVLLYLRGPVIAVINNVPHLLNAQVALQQLAALQLQRANIEDKVEALPVAQPWRELVLEHVTYHYHETGDVAVAQPPRNSQLEANDEGFTLGPLSLRLVPGEVVFICGGNGSGKSTLARLLTALYRPHVGCLKVDGCVVKSDTDVATYQARFSAIFGDYHLFPEVLDQHGQPCADSLLQQSLGEFGLAHKVTVQDGVFQTTQLSLGQRKRLALIAALAEDRPILLLDEWAAEQDPRFRRYFYRELIPALRAQGKTIIAITHDDQYFDVADRLLHPEQGELREVTAAMMTAVQ